MLFLGVFSSTSRQLISGGKTNHADGSCREFGQSETAAQPAAPPLG